MTQTQLGVVQQAVAALKTKRDLKPWCSAHPELFGQLGFEDLFRPKLPVPELQQQIMARISATVSQALSLRDQASASPSGCEI